MHIKILRFFSITYREYIFNISTKKSQQLPTKFSMYPRETTPFLSEYNILILIGLFFWSRNISFTFDFSLFQVYVPPGGKQANYTGKFMWKDSHFLCKYYVLLQGVSISCIRYLPQLLKVFLLLKQNVMSCRKGIYTEVYDETIRRHFKGHYC